MTDQTCVRGCTRRGDHYAACDDYGRTDGDCRGCVLREARPGGVVCHRCYGRLRRMLEQTPPLIEHIRSRMTGVGAKQYTRMPTGVRGQASEPTPTDIIDATRDIMAAIYAPPVAASASADEWRDAASEGILRILNGYEELTNDVHAFPQWWELIMPHQVPGSPDFWTVGRALARWPLEDRRRQASAPCPECDLRDVIVHPPTAPAAPTWFACRQCDWERSEHDDDGLWVSVFDAYNPNAATVDDTTELTTPVAEWDDPLLNRTDAGRVAGSASTLRRWVQKGLISPEGTITIAGSPTTLFRRSELMQVKADELAKKHAGRPPRSREYETARR